MREDDVRCVSLMKRDPTGEAVILPQAIDNHTVIIPMILPEPGNELRCIAILSNVRGVEGSNLNRKISQIRRIGRIERENFYVDVASRENLGQSPYAFDWAAARGIGGMDQM